MDDFICAIKTLCDDKNHQQLSELFRKNGEAFLQNATHIDQVVGALDLEHHSFACLTLLAMKVSFSNCGDFELLFVQIQQCISMSQAEVIQLLKNPLCELCHYLTSQLVNKKQPLKGVQILITAIVKLQKSKSQLTPIHADLMQLCLLAKCFKPALPFLNENIVEIMREDCVDESRQFLLYFYYGGMIFTALKKFDRALFFYEIAITTPASDISYIMLNAYKKFILVSLIEHAKIISLPKYAPQVVAKYLTPSSSCYHELANAFCSSNPSGMNNIVTKYSDEFTADTNMGLVKQVIKAMYKVTIKRLTKTFLTLSLQDMAARVGLNNVDEAENYVLRMIEEGEIYASINQKDGMVSFYNSPEKYNDPRMLKQLDDQIREYQDVDNKLSAMDKRLALNPKYIKKTSAISGSFEDEGLGKMKDDAFL
ncbi:COP9 signalosome complex subunit 3-like [Xenia sp. Carnegie-2017]|uniref:COP9 signalosome complex subunit 3-like n=1 Tax=Xenia sp. Carnegie-2017 TaxID=2897299 RepID=UPI001F03F965|nr:COP9 signalosome complex subunit 3-like [Xenia sp. Carnegie-2017]XP_046849536.1 COP9 signalosome complex subunit 3-like [Xenia sp. Carnegie-2017]